MRFSRLTAGIGLIACAWFVMAIPTLAVAAGGCVQQVDLRELMTVATFDQAGLGQLDHGQLTALDDWLSRNGRGLCPAPATASPVCSQPVDLRDFMTVSAFDQAGLNRLDSNQIAALNDWLKRNAGGLCGAPAAPQPPAGTTVPGNANTGEAAFGAPPVRTKTPHRIESRIVGDFHGWTGNTVFQLENGQIWKQAGPGYFQVDLHSPKVVIKKLLIGYVLLVDGYAKEVFVRRVQ